MESVLYAKLDLVRINKEVDRRRYETKANDFRGLLKKKAFRQIRRDTQGSECNRVA